MLKLIILSAAVVSQLVANINGIATSTASDPEQAALYDLLSNHGYENGTDMRELYLKVPMTEAEVLGLRAIQNEDGSYSDINYQDKHRGAWPVSMHAFRVQRLAIYYKQHGDEKALQDCLSAMRYWFAQAPVCPNWWHNEIGIPRLMGPAFVMVKERLDSADLSGAVAVMAHSGLRQTGQNKVWQAGNVLIRGILQDDVALIREARDSIASEIRISDFVEGLQKDWSFHQHGPQLQFGNYGLSYAVSLCWWARALEGTEFAFSRRQMEILRDYVRRGLGQVVWNGWFDPSACARQVFLNAQKGKAVCVEIAASNLGVSLEYGPGAVYFPCSDFGVYRGKGWYSSIRMQSAGLKGFENTNGENMKGYFSSDGALLVRTSGDEYDNIFPFWDWKRIPGTTTYDNGKPLWGGESKRKEPPYYNESDKVFGKARGKKMAAAMEVCRDSLYARKAWFFWKGGIVCLGAGISRTSEDQVVTTIEQNLYRGECSTGEGWAFHDGTAYVVLDGSWTAGKKSAKGSWSPIYPAYSDEDVCGEVFEMFIDHGSAPSDATYAYVVVPCSRKGAKAARMVRLKVKVIENTPRRQVVRIGLRRYKVDWEKGRVCI